jgi:hypothetical protein
MSDDCSFLSKYINDFELLSTTTNEREKMMEPFISFVRMNKESICDLYNENDWSHTLIGENDQFQNSLRKIIQDMNRRDKQIINVLITQFATELELFDDIAISKSVIGTDDFIFSEIPEYDHVNRCTECGVDMGSSNPRQFCRKTYCENI